MKHKLSIVMAAIAVFSSPILGMEEDRDGEKRPLCHEKDKGKKRYDGKDKDKNHEEDEPNNGENRNNPAFSAHALALDIQAQEISFMHTPLQFILHSVFGPNKDEQDTHQQKRKGKDKGKERDDSHKSKPSRKVVYKTHQEGQHLIQAYCRLQEGNLEAAEERFINAGFETIVYTTHEEYCNKLRERFDEAARVGVIAGHAREFFKLGRDMRTYMNTPDCEESKYKYNSFIWVLKALKGGQYDNLTAIFEALETYKALKRNSSQELNINVLDKL